MAIEIVPAPGRQFKTWSMIIVIALGSVDAAYLLLSTFGQMDLLSKEAVLAINAVIAFLIVPVRLIQQNIPATTEQKIAVVAAAAAQPVHAGESNIEVKVDEAVLPSTPTQKEGSR